jgi:hypothetical protein
VLLEAKLVSEADARQFADACNTFESHPDGVWLLTVRGVFEDQTRTIRMYLDAPTGEQLCGEEISVNATHWPTLPPPPTPQPPPAATFPLVPSAPIARPVSDWANRIAYRGDDDGLCLMKPDGSDRRLAHLPADTGSASYDTRFV